MITFAFESLLQNFGLIWTGSKFGNFGLGDGESWKIQYRSHIKFPSPGLIEQHILDTNEKTTVLSRHRCIINAGIKKMNNI
jgi:hypothetical protein